MGSNRGPLKSQAASDVLSAKSSTNSMTGTKRTFKLSFPKDLVTLAFERDTMSPKVVSTASHEPKYSTFKFKQARNNHNFIRKKGQEKGKDLAVQPKFDFVTISSN
jgi:hypothetical protein